MAFVVVYDPCVLFPAPLRDLLMRVGATGLVQPKLIVTANLKDFPADALKPFGIEAQSPDDFIFNLIDLAPELRSQGRNGKRGRQRCWALSRSW